MSKSPWYDSDDPDRVARGFGGRVMAWTIAFVLFFGLVGIGIWAFRVATSDFKGQGDAAQQKNSGTNRIAAQERFEDLYADIVAADRRIDVQAAALKAAPHSHVAQTNLTGAITYCIEVVGDYNAEARKYTAQEFRSIDLPAQVDNNDPTTDCKESLR